MSLLFARDRQVVEQEKEDGPGLELYPLHFYIVRHLKVNSSASSNAPSARPSMPFSSLGATAAGGFFGGFDSGSASSPSPQQQQADRIKREVVARVLFSQQHTIRFVRQFLCKQLRVNSDEVRLWQLYLKPDGSFDVRSVQHVYICTLYGVQYRCSALTTAIIKRDQYSEKLRTDRHRPVSPNVVRPFRAQ